MITRSAHTVHCFPRSPQPLPPPLLILRYQGEDDGGRFCTSDQRIGTPICSSNTLWSGLGLGSIAAWAFHPYSRGMGISGLVPQTDGEGPKYDGISTEPACDASIWLVHRPACFVIRGLMDGRRVTLHVGRVRGLA